MCTHHSVTQKGLPLLWDFHIQWRERLSAGGGQGKGGGEGGPEGFSGKPHLSTKIKLS